MNKVILKKIELANFKGFAKADRFFDENRETISAENGQGKTTLRDAWFWVLGFNVADVIPCRNNKEIPNLEIVVSCEVSIYKGDVFEFTIVDGKKVVTKHEQKFENIKNENIIGAYATVKFKDGSTMSDVMTTEEIKKSWAMSRAGGSVHSAFTHEMCIKTVKSRLAKHLNNSTDDEANLEPETPSIKGGEVIYADEIPDADYVEVDETEYTEEIEATDDVEPVVVEKVCSVCGKKLSDKVFDFSTSTYGKPLCMKCQQEE